MNHGRPELSCSEIRELLSPYHDGELADNQRSRVADHLEACSACAREKAGLQSLTEMAGALSTPPPPAQMWSELELKLDEKQPAIEPAGQGQDRRWLSRSSMLVLAVAVLMALGISWGAYKTWLAHGEHGQFAAEFGHYLDEFQRDPDSSQEFLLGKYQNEPVSPHRAISRVGYRPAVADGLPEEYQLVSTHVMKMPCCTCVQSLCRRPDGSLLAIFEHDDKGATEWFGDRPEVAVHCEQKQCFLVELDEQNVAATWQRGTRHITLIGVRDVSEFSRMVAWLDENAPVLN